MLKSVVHGRYSPKFPEWVIDFECDPIALTHVSHWMPYFTPDPPEFP